MKKTVKTSVKKVSPKELMRHAGIIKKQHGVIVSNGKGMLEAAFVAGNSLNSVKETMKRGDWEKWVGRNLHAIGLRQCQQYMLVSRKEPEIRKLMADADKAHPGALWTIKGAIRKIAKSRSKTPAVPVASPPEASAAQSESEPTLLFQAHVAMNVREWLFVTKGDIAMRRDKMIQQIKGLPDAAQDTAASLAREISTAMASIADAIAPPAPAAASSYEVGVIRKPSIQGAFLMQHT